MNKLKNIGLIMMSIAILTLFLLWWFKAGETKTVYVPNPKVEIVYKDSVLYRDSLRIYSKAIIVYRDSIVYDLINNIPDTIKIATKPFVASLDTIYKDTLSIRFYYPENYFDLRIKYKLDTLRVPERTITVEVEKPKTFFEKYIEKPLYFTGGLLVGFLIGSSK
jgi:hypothetical protein